MGIRRIELNLNELKHFETFVCSNWIPDIFIRILVILAIIIKKQETSWFPTSLTGIKNAELRLCSTDLFAADMPGMTLKILGTAERV